MGNTTASMGTGGTRLVDVSRALGSARDYLFSLQNADGHWCGELEGDTILESEYVLAMHFLGRTDCVKVRKAANYIRQQQLPEGGWSIYPGGGTDVSASTKAYLTLKLVGDAAEAPHMLRARRAILAAGGLGACNSFTKIYLSIFGQYDWGKCPAIPPEIVLLPRWSGFDLYAMSSWSRAIVVPLSIVRALRPSCPMPRHADISELASPDRPEPARSPWARLFLMLDKGIKMVGWVPVKPARQVALKRAEAWILERLEGSDGLGAIFPPIVNCIFALRALGYPADHPVFEQQVRELEKLEIEEGDTLRVQPCFSPVWDTALAMDALVEAGIDPADRRLLRGADWLLDRRGHDRGDWRVRSRMSGGSSAGWYFEYANPYYPDCDTTAQTIIALQKLRFPASRADAFRGAIDEAHRWHLSLQNRDGGWGAFDRGCDKEVLTHVPFADHNAMIDPSTADLTARSLEKMAALGLGLSFAPARRAATYLLRQQESDGSWFGRWGCNYIYGTWLAVVGLAAIGEDVRGAWARRAAGFLSRHQNEDGGWGESPRSYEDVADKAKGPSTASQTAWALLALMALGEAGSDAVRRGVGWLQRTQNGDGSWTETQWTGTGFPCVFYLRYHLYPIYFPVRALGQYAAQGESLARRREAPAEVRRDGMEAAS